MPSVLASLTGDGVSPAGFAVQGVCSAAAERGGWEHSTGECLGKETHLLTPECGIDTCSWTRKQSLFFRKGTNPKEHPFGAAPSCLLVSLEDNEGFVTAQGSWEPKQPPYELSGCKSAGSTGC